MTDIDRYLTEEVLETALREFAKPRMTTNMSLDGTRAKLAAALSAVAPLIAAQALEAVLEMHYPEPYAQGPDYCAECEHRYPCPTARAITTTLEAS